MRILCFFILVLIISSLFFAQTIAIAWQKSFGGTATDRAIDFKQSPDKGHIFCGGFKKLNAHPDGFTIYTRKFIHPAFIRRRNIIY